MLGGPCQSSAHSTSSANLPTRRPQPIGLDDFPLCRSEKRSARPSVMLPRADAVILGDVGRVERSDTRHCHRQANKASEDAASSIRRKSLRSFALRDLVFSVEAARSRSEAALAAFRTDDDECCALTAAGNTDGVFGPLNAAHIRPLQRRLDDFSGNDRRCCLWAVHFELPTNSRLSGPPCSPCLQGIALG